MNGINRCPYCGGEVEMVKLNKKRKTDTDMFRIDCRSCHYVVPKGRRFPGESKADEDERIAQYEKIMKDYYAPARFTQTAGARSRDNQSRFSHKAGV